ncbi:MAG TPA: hypothetical protein VLD57_07075 [Blastocatellia bacterium]|nr:hypothetical protein [Blastocatellia bacterium]
MRPRLIELLMSELGLKEKTAEHAVDIVINYMRNNPLKVAAYLGRQDESSTRARQGGPGS